tara:strand:+ start:2175 stop:2462 length:288 start_codon:yes stop_codon:yes gene_type:complete
MGKKIIFSLIIVFTSTVGLQIEAKSDYWLVIGSYRQGPGGKPQVSGITSPSLFAIPIGTEKMCMKAGEKIANEIYKPVWQFDNKWTCIKNSINKK